MFLYFVWVYFECTFFVKEVYFLFLCFALIIDCVSLQVIFAGRYFFAGVLFEDIAVSVGSDIYIGVTEFIFENKQFCAGLNSPCSIGMAVHMLAISNFTMCTRKIVKSVIINEKFGDA